MAVKASFWPSPVERPGSKSEGKPLHPDLEPEVHSRDRADLSADSRAGDRHEFRPNGQSYTLREGEAMGPV